MSFIQDKLKNMPPQLKRITIIVFLGLTALVSALLFKGVDKPVETAPVKIAAPAPMPQAAPQPLQIETVTSPDRPAMPQSDKYPPLPPPPDNALMQLPPQGVDRGMNMFGLQSLKEQKDIEAAIRKAELEITKAENERKKEEIKGQFYASFPELVFDGKVEIPKPKAPEPANIAQRHIDMLEQVKLVGIVKDVAIWQTPMGRVVTKAGSAIAGYVVSTVCPDGVDLKKDGRHIKVLL